MNDEAAFLAAIIANPADDLVRLVYADWLDGAAGTVKRCSGTHRHPGRPGAVIHGVMHEGDPRKYHHHCDEKCWVLDGRAERAEFIRLQVGPRPRHRLLYPAKGELRRDCRPDCPACRGERRELELWSIHHSEWFDPGFDRTIEDTARGFLHTAHAKLAAFWDETACRHCGQYRTTDRSHLITCATCGGKGTTPAFTKLATREPLQRVVVTDAVIYQSGGSNTYYLGGLGVFPREYWRGLTNLPSRAAVRDALSTTLLSLARKPD